MATIDIAMESTSQQILNAVTSSSGSGYSSGMQEFTSSGTFVVPDGVGVIYVTACGAGGSGATGNASPDNSGRWTSGGGGGAGQCVYNYILKVTPKQELAITIGAGGIGPSTTRTNGKDGGTTSIGNLLTLKGGGKGYAGTSYDATYFSGGNGGSSDYADGGTGGATGGGTGTNTASPNYSSGAGKSSGMTYPPILPKGGNFNSSISYPGGLGGSGGTSASSNYGGGGGGASIFGAGGAGGSGGHSSTNYEDTTLGGNGGIGAGGGGSTKEKAGNGGNGKVVIVW